ncbi:hypothetical protein YB2330_001861 [Saitoella coloradoensis]
MSSPGFLDEPLVPPETPKSPLSFDAELKTLEDIDIAAEREARIREQQRQRYEKAAGELREIVTNNSSLHVNISSIRIAGTERTRPAFLEQVLEPILNSQQSDESLGSSLDRLQRTADRLKRFGIFDDISISLDRAESPLAHIHDVDATLHLTESSSRVSIQPSTYLSGSDASARVRVSVGHLFGGAEELSFGAEMGNRTRNAYEVKLDAPWKASPDTRVSLSGFSSHRDNRVQMSYEELQRGVKLLWTHQDPVPGSARHEFGYEATWRTLTNLLSTASPIVKSSSGDSVKSSLVHRYALSTLDNELLPTSGYSVRTLAELAGVGPLGGDAHHLKTELHTSTAHLLHIPSQTTATLGLRTGCMYGLRGSTKIQDRFHLGGPSNVRGFREAGLGPHQRGDSVGGEVYLAFGLGLQTKIPLNTSPSSDHGLRFQTFLNGGSLLALDPSRSVSQTLVEIVTRPSVSTGVGLVWAGETFGQPLKVEANFVLPILARRGEGVRKGVQVGVGLEFM